MELTGEEKRMQTLFSELRLADQQAAPSFAATWSRAQARSFRPRRAFNLSFAAVTALLICALVTLAWWSRRLQPTPQSNVVATTPVGTVPGAKPSELTPTPNVKPASGADSQATTPGTTRRRIELNARRRADRIAAQREASLFVAAQKQATAISNWQSPTSTLLNSTNDNLLKSVPKLNESTTELKSFLPNTPK